MVETLAGIIGSRVKVSDAVLCNRYILSNCSLIFIFYFAFILDLCCSQYWGEKCLIAGYSCQCIDSELFKMMRINDYVWSATDGASKHSALLSQGNSEYNTRRSRQSLKAKGGGDALWNMVFYTGHVCYTHVPQQPCLPGSDLHRITPVNKCSPENEGSRKASALVELLRKTDGWYRR